MVMDYIDLPFAKWTECNGNIILNVLNELMYKVGDASKERRGNAPLE
jgi:hypothetical protein